MCMYGPPGTGRRPVQVTVLARSDCSEDHTVAGPPLTAWIAPPATVPALDEREPELITEGAA